MNMPDDKEHKGEFDGKTFLYIRTNPADDGTEPLPSGLPCWISPDITIIQPGGMRGGEAIAGQINNVEVIVTNDGGIDAIDAYVEAFVCDPSTGFTPATAKPIGNDFLTIPGYNTATIAFSWIPLISDEGHRCILARVCLGIPPDCYKNGNIFDPIGDRHVAQRNISVLKFDEKSSNLSFGFKIVNPFGNKRQFLIQSMEVKTEKNADMIRAALGCRLMQFAGAPLKDINLHIGEVVSPKDFHLIEKSKDILCGVLPKPINSKTGRRDKIEMDEGEIRYAVINLSRNEKVRPGDVNVVQVEQIDIKTEQSVGGLWLIVQA